MHRAISGTALETMVNHYRKVTNIIERMSRVYPEDVLQKMVYLPAISEQMLKDRGTIDAWCQQLAEALDAGNGAGSHRYSVAAVEDTERQLFLPRIEIVAHGVPHQYRISQDFVTSGEYAAIVALGDELQGLLEDGSLYQTRRTPERSHQLCRCTGMADERIQSWLQHPALQRTG